MGQLVKGRSMDVGDMNDMDNLHFQWLKQVQRPLMDLLLQWLQLCVIRSVLTIIVSHMVMTIPRVI